MSEDLDERYRRESQADRDRPSEWVRRSVLEHATQLAAGRRRQASGRGAKGDGMSPGRWWVPAIVGTLAASVLAGLLVAPMLSDSPSSSPQYAHSSARPPTTAPRPSPPEQSKLPPDAAPPAPSARTPRASTKSGVKPVPGTQHLNSMSAPASRAETARSSARLDDAVSALGLAAEHGDLPALQLALTSGVDVDSPDAQGRTALLRATLSGEATCVEALLSHGADPNLGDSSGTTPLQAALAGHRDDIAQSLRRAGAR